MAVNDPPDTSVVQSDLSVNLFMVLLAVLSTLTVVMTVVSSDGFRVNLRSEQSQLEDPILGLSRGWLPVQPRRDRLIIRSDGLWLFDSSKLAGAFAAGQSVANSIPGYDMSKILLDDPDPQAYLVQLTTLDDPLHQDIYSWFITTENLSLVPSEPWPDPWKNTLADSSQIDLMVFKGGETLAWEVARRLYEAGASYRFLFPRKPQIAFVRRTSDFKLEAIYK